jgi:hypothetical protein
MTSSSGTDNVRVIAALGQINRVCHVYLWNFVYRELEEVLAAMQVPFPELTALDLALWGTPPVIPDSFLVDLPHVCDTSRWKAFHFRDCQICFCLLLTLSPLSLKRFLTPGTFHPKQWSLSSPCCPASKHFTLDSYALNLDLTGKPQVRLHRNVISSPPSKTFMGLSSI